MIKAFQFCGCLLCCFLLLTPEESKSSVQGFSVTGPSPSPARFRGLRRSPPLLIPSLKSHEGGSRSISPSDLLYQEQEKLLVARGEFEGKLFHGKGTPLPAHIVKGTGSPSGGFGKKQQPQKAKTKTKFNPTVNTNQQLLAQAAKSHAQVLQTEGVLRIDKVLSSADALREYVYDLRQQYETEIDQGLKVPQDCFADVLLKSNRCDMPLPIDNPLVKQALQEVLFQTAVGSTIELLLGPDAVLYELSCLISDPGSQRQVMHPDTPCQKDKAVLYTCFVALQDITPDMGPTTWLPRTHKPEVHAQFQQDQVLDDDSAEGVSSLSPKDALLTSLVDDAQLGCLPKGSCALFDSRVLHCGGSNQSLSSSRALFYFSFQRPKIVYVGNPGSIRNEYIGQFTLQDLKNL